MFSRKSPEVPSPLETQNQIAFQDSRLSPSSQSDSEPDFSPSENQPEIVKIVEKISNIISPYFIAIVGLYLYDRNVIIGFLLITIGLISLLKITLKDLDELIDKIRNFFTLKE